MEGLIETDTKQMEKTVENIEKTITEIKTEIHVLTHSLKKIDPEQKEIASITFFHEFQQDCKTLFEFCEFLEAYCENMRLAIQYYQGNEVSINDTVFWFSV